MRLAGDPWREKCAAATQNVFHVPAIVCQLEAPSGSTWGEDPDLEPAHVDQSSTSARRGRSLRVPWPCGRRSGAILPAVVAAPKTVVRVRLRPRCSEGSCGESVSRVAPP